MNCVVDTDIYCPSASEAPHGSVHNGIGIVVDVSVLVLLLGVGQQVGVEFLEWVSLSIGKWNLAQGFGWDDLLIRSEGCAACDLDGIRAYVSTAGYWATTCAGSGPGSCFAVGSTHGSPGGSGGDS